MLAFSKHYYFTCWVHAPWLCCAEVVLVHYAAHVVHPIHDHLLSIPSIFVQVTKISFPEKKAIILTLSWNIHSTQEIINGFVTFTDTKERKQCRQEHWIPQHTIFDIQSSQIQHCTSLSMNKSNSKWQRAILERWWWLPISTFQSELHLYACKSQD